MAYKLGAVLRGHELDVRSVAAGAFPEGSILTGSRDRTCRLWSKQDGTFIEQNIFTGHSRYVSAVCQFPPSEKYPTGLVVTGGHDNLILMFSLDSNEPVMRLEGHTGAVCALKCGNYGTLLSGSWDKTARVWINGRSVMTLEDHEAAVWSVETMPDHGFMLTASADKTIKLWKAGQCERTFVGHTDCVRSLAVLSRDEFLSCGNDCSVRRWHVAGECIAVYDGHSSFIYSISTFPLDSDCYATSGEDRSVKVWHNGDCLQTIMLPCQSVWSVACLQNGDVVVGTSDGIVRVFTKDKERVAAASMIEEFENELANQAIPAAANLDLGDIKIDQLPGPEALLVPGSGDGKPRLIKRNGVVEAYQWDTIDQKWQKVGDVVGKAGEDGSARKGNKEMFEGKEYDFVFSVDIEEGKPPLKLPFDLTEDPYMAAHKFLEKNNLSPMFLDQVASFIITNTKGFELGGPPPSFSDPFTGGSRYVPGGQSNSDAQQQNSVPSSRGADPFTGSSCYVSGTSNGVTTPTSQINSKYFPQSKYLYFDAGKTAPIVSKLKDFNQSVTQDKALSDAELQVVAVSLDSCVGSPEQVNLEQQVGVVMEKLLLWPTDKLLPVLDSLRLFIRTKSVSSYFFSEDRALVSKLLQLTINEEAPINNQMLVYRVISNCFSELSESTLTSQMDDIVNAAASQVRPDHKTQPVAIATVLLNFAVLSKKCDFEVKVAIAAAVMQGIQPSSPSEATFRLLVALGTLVHDDQELIAFAKSCDVVDKLAHFKAITDPAKICGCATELLSLLSA